MRVWVVSVGLRVCVRVCVHMGGDCRYEGVCEGVFKGVCEYGR